MPGNEKLRKVPLSEAKDFPLGFEFTEKMFVDSLPQLDNILRSHGVREEFLQGKTIRASAMSRKKKQSYQ